MIPIEAMNNNTTPVVCANADIANANANADITTTPAAADHPSSGEVTSRRRYPRYSEERLRRRLGRLRSAAMDCLEEIMKDGDAKAADRIAAAKLTFDAAGRQGAAEPEPGGVIRVLFDGMPEEYAE